MQYPLKTPHVYGNIPPLNWTSYFLWSIDWLNEILWSDALTAKKVDFVIFPPRWLPAEGTFRPPWQGATVAERKTFAVGQNTAVFLLQWSSIITWFLKDFRLCWGVKVVKGSWESRQARVVEASHSQIRASEVSSKLHERVHGTSHRWAVEGFHHFVMGESSQLWKLYQPTSDITPTRF